MPQEETAEEALMRELRGEEGASITVLDKPPAEPVEPDPMLAQVEPPKPSAVTVANEKFSTKTGGDGFAVTVKGEYFAPSKDQAGKKVKKPYEVVVNLPELAPDALSIIKNKILGELLRRKYPDFAGVRTHEIVSAKPLSPRTPESRHIQFASRATLVAHIETIGAPIDPEEYPQDQDLRSAVMDYANNPKGFEKREALRQESRRQDAELRRLNPDLNKPLE